jgi:hypothetical protein
MDFISIQDEVNICGPSASSFGSERVNSMLNENFPWGLVRHGAANKQLDHESIHLDFRIEQLQTTSLIG